MDSSAVCGVPGLSLHSLSWQQKLKEKAGFVSRGSPQLSKRRFSFNSFGHNRHIDLKQQAEVCY